MATLLEQIAPLGFLLISSFLSYPSQYLLRYLEPGPLSPQHSIIFNIEVLLFYICYARTVWTDPGLPGAGLLSSHNEMSNSEDQNRRKTRWCRKCDQIKPPRAHHCKVCQRCVLKMDHHCPWAANCVGHRNLPHFTRFLFFSAIGMAHLGSFLFTRWAALWNDRHLASSLGPSRTQLIHLMSLSTVNVIAGSVVFILLARRIWGLGGNMTTIETWEMERHEALLRRARVRGGFLQGPGGVMVRIVRHEFPYDIGIFANIAQGMGSRNPLIWFWPFATSPTSKSGADFEINDFNEPGMTWPPPDPDKLPRPTERSVDEAPYLDDENLSRDQQLDAFRQRQSQDLASKRRYKSQDRGDDAFGNDSRSITTAVSSIGVGAGSRSWRNDEGETLDDYGVDEAADADDDVPLAQLIASRKSE